MRGTRGFLRESAPYESHLIPAQASLIFTAPLYWRLAVFVRATTFCVSCATPLSHHFLRMDCLRLTLVYNRVGGRSYLNCELHSSPGTQTLLHHLLNMPAQGRRTLSNNNSPSLFQVMQLRFQHRRRWVLQVAPMIPHESKESQARILVQCRRQTHIRCRRCLKSPLALCQQHSREPQ